MTDISLRPAGSLAPPRAEPQLPIAAQVLSHRTLTVVGQGAIDAARRIDLEHGGLVLTGKDSTAKARLLRRTYPDMVVIAEPASHEHHVATEEAPFLLPPREDGFFARPLQDVVQGQRDSGVSVVLLPSGHLQVGDNDSLRAMQRISDSVDGDDIVLHLSGPSEWLMRENLSVLIAVAKRSRHPAMFSFSSTTNPLATKRALSGYRELFQSVPNAFAHRTDMAGFDAVAHGAIGASIGMIPGLRRSTAPGDKGKARTPADRSPHMFVPGLLRYVKSSTLRLDWFPSTEPLSCDCAECRGSAIDRLTGSDGDRLQGHSHNIRTVQALAAGYDGGDFTKWWREQRESAIAASQELSTKIGRTLRLSDDLGFWSTMEPRD